MSLLTFAGGSLTSLFGGAIYALCPVSPGNQQVQQAWLTFVMTMGRRSTLKVPAWQCHRWLAGEPNLVGLTLPAHGRAAHLARAAEPLTAQWEAAVRPRPLLLSTQAPLPLPYPQPYP